jgi:Flp pilus assembly protein TadG
MRHRLAAGGDSEGGTILLLTIGFALIALSLVLVVMDVSKVFLTRRSLVSAADGAALAGVQSLDRDAFYAGNDGDALPLDADTAVAAVRTYVDEAGLAGDYADFTLVSIQVTGAEVTVTLRARSVLPFGTYVGHPDGVVVEATAHATAPYLD